MAPPTYNDLGKSCKDVFGKGYNFNVLKLDVKTKSQSGVDFSVGGNRSLESGKVSGNLETKYQFKDHGVTFTEKWNTDNALNTVIDFQDKTKGLKLTLDSSFVVATGEKKGKLKGEYKHDLITVNGDMDINAAGPLMNASAVVGHKGWLFGYQGAFDSGKSKLTKSNISVGYVSPDFTAHSCVNDGNIYTGSLHQKINGNIETGVNIGWTKSTNVTSFGIGLTCKLDKDTSVRAKINNSSQVGLGLQQKLRDGVTLTLSSLIDGGNLNQGSHKFGLGIELQA